MLQILRSWNSADHRSTLLRSLPIHPQSRMLFEVFDISHFLCFALLPGRGQVKPKSNICSGILHTIFFHRFFPSIRPKTRDILDLTLPFVDDAELETLIDQRTATLVRQLDTSSDMGVRSTGVRGLMAVQFFEKKRRKAWFTKGEEEICWEQWTLDVTLATPRTESGMPSIFFQSVSEFQLDVREWGLMCIRTSKG